MNPQQVSGFLRRLRAKFDWRGKNNPEPTIPSQQIQSKIQKVIIATLVSKNDLRELATVNFGDREDENEVFRLLVQWNFCSQVAGSLREDVEMHLTSVPQLQKDVSLAFFICMY